MAPRHNDPSRTRERILERATEEFAQRGFEGGRVDRIAARSRLSKNMLYYYFQSKEKLFVAVLERMYEAMRNQQKDLALRTSDPVLALEQLIRHTFKAMRDDAHVIRLINEENKHHGKYLKKSQRVRELYDPLLQTIKFILDRGSKEGVFRPSLDPVTVYLTFSSLCYHYLSNLYTLGNCTRTRDAIGRRSGTLAAPCRRYRHAALPGTDPNRVVTQDRLSATFSMHIEIVYPPRRSRRFRRDGVPDAPFLTK